MKFYLIIFLIYSTKALPDGAPTSVCKTLRPFHGDGIFPDNGLSPYTLPVKQQEDVVQVAITSSLGIRFRGFVVQGRTPDGQIIGTFQVPGGTSAHTIACTGAGDTVTHNDNSDKERVELIWIPPVGYQGIVIFNSTVVQNYVSFWVGVESNPVKIQRRFAKTDNFYSGCGVTKYCYGAPIDCVATQNCKVAVAVTSVGEAFDFELKSGGNSVWAAIGLSDDTKMGDDSVVECVKDRFGTIDAFMSWTGRAPFQAKRLENPKLGINLLNASVNSDELYCKVRRNTVTNVKGNIFDLRRNSFHVLVATGSELKNDSVGFHDIAFLASPDPQVLSPNSQTLFAENEETQVYTETTTPLYFQPTTPKQSSTEFDPFYDGCNNVKLCFGSPAGCVQSKNCKAVTAVTFTGNNYDFEIKATGNAAWVGVGLSDDDKMGDDSVIECVKGPKGVATYMSVTGVKPYRAERIPNQQSIKLLNSSIIDDTIYCKVRRDAETKVNSQIYNLIQDSYYLLVAAGHSVTANNVSFHDIAFLASAQKQALADTSEVAAASKLLLRLHGAFMLVAWIGTASLGIIMARFYKQTWVEKSMMGKDLWFAWHRIFMVLTVLFTMAAFVLIFVELKDWSSEPHAILGLVTSILCFIQPLMAYFRPHPGTPKRPIFNWAHWLVGNAAHTIAIVTLFFAVRLTKAELPEEVDYILVAYVVLHVVAHLILSILYCVSEKSPESRVSSFPMKDFNGTGRNSAFTDRNMDARFSAGRKCILGVYIVILAVLLLALILITVLAPIQLPF